MLLDKSYLIDAKLNHDLDNNMVTIRKNKTIATIFINYSVE